jgi:hypothetical protein
VGYLFHACFIEDIGREANRLLYEKEMEGKYLAAALFDFCRDSVESTLGSRKKDNGVLLTEFARKGCSQSRSNTRNYRKTYH